MQTERAIHEVVDKFKIEGELLSVVPYKSGHINETFLSTWRGRDRAESHFIHQWVNDAVFKDIPALMSNIMRVTTHLQAKLKQAGDGADRTLSVVLSKAGDTIVRDQSGGYWRTYDYIENTESFGVCTGTVQAKEAAATLGRFQRCLEDFDPKLLTDTIPNFHNTPLRYETFVEVLDEDRMGRAKKVKKEIEFALSRRESGSVLVRGLEKGQLPTRVTHNDMKLNNVLFHERSGRGVCVVDLDTVMAGSSLYDFGDLVRNTSVPAAEDEQDLSKVEMDIQFFEALVQGYAQDMGGCLTREEVDLMVISPRVMALTLGLRFLTDHLNGDTYFRIHRSNHNLDRARTQFKIVQSMENQEKAMRAIVANFFEAAPRKASAC